jgi:crossover junction endodeoxyribonuclease RuvC
MSVAYRVLGIDPGSRMMGYGVIDVRGARLDHVDSGTVSISLRLPMAARLLSVFESVTGLIARHAPGLLAVEDVFYARNVRSAITLGQARGAVLIAAAKAGLAVHTYAPAEIKMAVAGSGRAEKAQVQVMVRAILSLETLPPTDAADALAAAICHAQRAKLDARVERATRGAARGAARGAG